MLEGYLHVMQSCKRVYCISRSLTHIRRDCQISSPDGYGYMPNVIFIFNTRLILHLNVVLP
jgi:hypothetical protein